MGTREICIIQIAIGILCACFEKCVPLGFRGFNGPAFCFGRFFELFVFDYLLITLIRKEEEKDNRKQTKTRMEFDRMKDRTLAKNRMGMQIFIHNYLDRLKCLIVNIYGLFFLN